MKIYKLLLIMAAILEILLGIPFLGAMIILSLVWTPLLVMLLLHITNFTLSKKYELHVPGVKLGILASILGVIPFVGAFLHIITGIILIQSVSKIDFEKEIVKKQKHEKLEYQKMKYKKSLVKLIKQECDISPDTNFLMLFDTLLSELYKEQNLHLYLSKTVFAELEGLKKDKSLETRIRAQKGFDIIELYQMNGRLIWTLEGNEPINKDARIVKGIQKSINNGNRIAFASHDKGARVLARTLSVPVVEPTESYD